MNKKMISSVKEKGPLILNITNYVTVNDCANIILAANGAPLMSDEIDEMDDLLAISSGLYVNIGTLNKRTIETMLYAGQKANELKIPVIFDPVGVGASQLRNTTVDRFLETVKVDVIKGNMSEIKSIVNRQANKGGVDVSLGDLVTEENLEESIGLVKTFAKSLKTNIVVTGAIDLVSDGEKVWIIRNGSKMMSKVTGTGCMLGALIATYCGANKEELLDATGTAVLMMSIAGELVQKKVIAQYEGSGSFRTYLLDYIGKIDHCVIETDGAYEIR